MKKYDLVDSPFTFNVIRNGSIWLKGFNDLSSAFRYCIRYAESHDNYIELWQSYGNRRFVLIFCWN